MINQRRWERQLEYVRRTDVHDLLERRLRPAGKGGRPRELRVDVLLAAMQLCVVEKGSIRQKDVHDLLTTKLSRSVQRIYGIRTHGEPVQLHQVRYLWSRITNMFEHTQARRPDMDDMERAACAELLNEVVDAFTGAASLHIGTGDRYAIDQTAIDSAARARRKKNADIRALRAKPIENDPRRRRAPNGMSFDVDAMQGHRTQTYDNRSEHVFGYQMNAFTRIGAVGGEDTPMLIDHFRLVTAEQRGIPETIDAPSGASTHWDRRCRGDLGPGA